MFAILLALVGGVCAAREVPFSILRFGTSVDGTRWPATLEMLRHNRESVDEVWFSTGCEIPPVAVHETRAAQQAKHAADVRALGIAASLQVQATIGHGSNRRDGQPAPHRTWNGKTGSDGFESLDCNCPRDPNYRAYWRAAIRPYAAWKPSSVWIDDDLRLIWHGGALKGEGCYCEHCVKAFAAKEGKAWTRATLVAALKNDKALHERWVTHGFEGMAGLAATIAAEIRRVSPETRLGLQYPWADRGQMQILEALAQEAGGKVAVRPGYGAYTDLNPLQQIEKVNRLSRQLKYLAARKEMFDQICPEIETYPRTFGTRTAKSLAFEALCELAQGCDSLSWFITGERETVDWYDRVVMRTLRENMPLYRTFVRANRATIACGFTMPDVGEGPFAPNWPTAYSLTGVPYTFGAGDILGTTLTSYAVGMLSDAALNKILAGATLTDYKTLERLQKRKLLPADYIRGAGRYTTPQKGRLGVSPHLSPENADAAENLRYRERALYAAKFLPAHVLDPCLAAVWCRVRDDGSRCFASMTLLNARIDEQESVRVGLTNFPAECAVWWELGKQPVELAVARAKGLANSCEVTLPRVGAWSAGFLVPGRVVKGEVVLERGGVSRQYIMKTGRIKQ